MKIIACTIDNKTYRYLALDQASGGYPYWTERLQAAEMYSDSADDLRAMRHQLREILTGKDHRYTDGTSYPNTMKHSALNLSDANPSGSGWVVVLALKLEREEMMAIDGAIKKPTGFVYD